MSRKTIIFFVLFFAATVCANVLLTNRQATVSAQSVGSGTGSCTTSGLTVTSIQPPAVAGFRGATEKVEVAWEFNPPASAGCIQVENFTVTLTIRRGSGATNTSIETVSKLTRNHVFTFFNGITVTDIKYAKAVVVANLVSKAGGTKERNF